MNPLRRLVEYKPGHHRPNQLRNGAIFLAIFGLVVLYAYTGGKLPFLPKGGEVVKAEFTTAANVSPGKTPVRVRGVDVGTVEKVERRGNGRGVVVTMRIDKPSGFELKRDARAHVYWRTLLGFAFYIELDPGTAARPLDDQTIPMSRTTVQAEADQLLASVDRPSRAGMRTMLQEFEKGFAGSAAGRSIDELAPAMRNVGPAVDGLRGTNPGDLTGMVRETSRLMGALARSEVELGQVVTAADTTLGVTAARRADLGRILDQAPAALSETSATMARLRTTLGELDPVAEALRPGARKLDDAALAVRPALPELRRALADAEPLLRGLEPSLRRLRSAARAGVPLLEQLDPTLRRLNDQIIPGLDKRDAGTKIKLYEAIGPVFATVASSASLWDVYGHTQRFQAVAGGVRSVTGAIPCASGQLGRKLDCSAVQKVLGGLLGLRTWGRGRTR